MALTETTVVDKIEIITEYKHVQIREANGIKKDDVEIARNFSRYVLHSGKLKGGFKEDEITPADDATDFINTDISSQPTEVQNICNAVWTTDVVNAYKTYLIAQVSS